MSITYDFGISAADRRVEESSKNVGVRTRQSQVGGLWPPCLPYLYDSMIPIGPGVLISAWRFCKILAEWDRGRQSVYMKEQGSLDINNYHLESC